MITREDQRPQGSTPRGSLRRPGFLRLLALLATGALAGCGGSTIEADPAVAPFVGTWDATVYQIWPDLAPTLIVDVLTEFGPFYITVEPSGQYTAVLEASPVPQVQLGQLTVVGAAIRLDVTTPPNQPTTTASFSFNGPDFLVLDGPIEVDFNDDGTRDPGGTHIELQGR